MLSEELDHNSIQIEELKKLPGSKLLELIYKYDIEMTLLRSKIETKSKQLEKVESESIEMKDQLGFIQKSNHVLSLELHTTNKRSEKYKEQWQSSQAEASRLKEELEEAMSNPLINKKFEEELESKENTIDLLNQHNSSLQVTIDSCKKENNEFRQQIFVLKERNRVLKDKQELVEMESLSAQENLVSKNKILKDTLKSTQQHLLNKKQRINELNEQISHLETQYSGVQDQLHHEQVKLKLTAKNLQEQKLNSELWEKKFQDLEFRHNLQDKKREKLVGMVKDIKMMGRQRNKRADCNSALCFFEIKTKLNDIYKNLIGEIYSESSVYQIESISFSHLEKQLNELICFIQEQIEEQESYSLPKEEKSLSQSYKKLISCVSPQLKSNLSQE